MGEIQSPYNTLPSSISLLKVHYQKLKGPQWQVRTQIMDSGRDNESGTPARLSWDSFSSSVWVWNPLR